MFHRYYLSGIIKQVISPGVTGNVSQVLFVRYHRTGNTLNYLVTSTWSGVPGVCTWCICVFNITWCNFHFKNSPPGTYPQVAFKMKNSEGRKFSVAACVAAWLLQWPGRKKEAEKRVRLRKRRSLRKQKRSLRKQMCEQHEFMGNCVTIAISRLSTATSVPNATKYSMQFACCRLTKAKAKCV